MSAAPGLDCAPQLTYQLPSYELLKNPVLNLQSQSTPLPTEQHHSCRSMYRETDLCFSFVLTVIFMHHNTTSCIISIAITLLIFFFYTLFLYF